MMEKVIKICLCTLVLVFLNACVYNEAMPDDKKYIINNELIEHDGENISLELEYPVLDNENDYYKEVNRLLLNEIVKLTELPLVDTRLEGRYYFTGVYEITEQTEDMVSLCYVISVFYEKGNNPIEYCYGLTFDILDGEKISLSIYIDDLDNCFNEVGKGNYSVEYGAFSLLTCDEVRAELEKEFSECSPDMCYNNFYIDGEGVCFIINDVMGSDYSVVKVKR